MDFVPFLNPCMLIQTIGGKKKKKQTKKSLYTTKTLLKNQRQHLVDGWVFYLLPFFAFLLPLLWEGVPLLILGYVGALCRELEIW